jgi:hypothetical protein
VELRIASGSVGGQLAWEYKPNPSMTEMSILFLLFSWLLRFVWLFCGVWRRSGYSHIPGIVDCEINLLRGKNCAQALSRAGAISLLAVDPRESGAWINPQLSRQEWAPQN